MLSFFHKVIDVLNGCGIEYMLSGSLAMSLYVEPRSTRDFDFVVHLRLTDVGRFTAEFSQGYYCDADAARDAIQHHSIFNVIDHATGYKADFMILKPEPFRQIEFSRRQEVDFLGKMVSVVTAEDLFLSKLCWIQEYQSALQLNDLSLLAELEELDWPYIYSWIKELRLKTFDFILP